MCRQQDDPRPPIPVPIQDEIRLKKLLRRQWQICRDLALNTAINRFGMSLPLKLNEWRNDQWSSTVESLDPEDQSLVKMNARMMKIPTPSSPLVTPRVFAITDSGKSRSPCRQNGDSFSASIDTSEQAVIEVVNEAIRAYCFPPASEPKLTNLAEVHDAIRVFNVCNALGPNKIQNRILKHRPPSYISFLVVLLNAIFVESSTSRQHGNTSA
jgi:hypothetical protein